MLSSTLQLKSRRKDIALPPTSIEHWLESENIVYTDWPVVRNRKKEHVLVDELGLTPFSQSEAIRRDLSAHAYFDDVMYDQLEDLVSRLSNKVNKLGSHIYKLETNDEVDIKSKSSDPFLTEDTDSESASSEDASHTTSKASTPYHMVSSKERTGRKPGKQGRAVRGQRGGGDKSEKKAQYAIFMGFDDVELTPLPGQIEPIRILDFVSYSQDFTTSYMKSWKKIFYSESSSAILQDFFWLIWLEKFNTETDIEPETPYKYFIRCSISYVKLFQRIPVKFRDLFFLRYSDCLAQSLYVAFWALFPGSRPEFDQSFRQFITTLIYTTVIGIEPPPLIWNEWRIDPDKFSQSLPSVQDSHSDISKLVAKPSTPSADKDERVASETEKEALLEYSPLIGLSPIYHNVKFNTLGKSPVVKCYMNTLGVSSQKGPSYINRAEIFAVPKPMKSYKQVMEKIREETTLRDIKLDKLLNSLDLDVKRKWTVCRKEMNQLKTESNKIKPKPRLIKIVPE
ncbi:hypothetical protein LOD99_4332 [Oopsacas minuta]|uniref:Uncharacterized protein n=1 Tax=Oopsacas minuta TaxID=111878 RepID=A0AAV7JUG3_9METZ|nr:hypothetical protein LOD99_4332 [Oopsacas minuta]